MIASVLITFLLMGTENIGVQVGGKEGGKEGWKVEGGLVRDAARLCQLGKRLVTGRTGWSGAHCNNYYYLVAFPAQVPGRLALYRELRSPPTRPAD